MFGNPQFEFESTKDPRSFWGNYKRVNLSDSCYDTDFDCNAPIFEHKWYNDSSATGSQYIVRHETLGWLVTSNPPTAPNVGVYCSCFKEDLFNCNYSTWYWGYLTLSDPLTEMRVKPTSCQPNFCVSDYTLTISETEIPFDGIFILQKIIQHQLFFYFHNPNIYSLFNFPIVLIYYQRLHQHVHLEITM